MKPARASRWLAFLLVMATVGAPSVDVRASEGSTVSVGTVVDAASRSGVAADRVAPGRHAPAMASAAATATTPVTGVDQWLDKIWWVAFVLTASAYVLVLGGLGVRRLRNRHLRHAAWTVPDLPPVTASGRHVGPHL